MGALLSGGITFAALLLGKLLGVKDKDPALEAGNAGAKSGDLNGVDSAPPPPA